MIEIDPPGGGGGSGGGGGLSSSPPSEPPPPPPMDDGNDTVNLALSDDAPATTSASDADGWWGLESDPPAASWKEADSPHLKSLKRVPSMHDSPESPPWKPGYELNIRGFGGLVNKERRRYTLVGHEGSYSNEIRGNRTVTADYHSTRVRGHRSVRIARPEDSEGLDASWGLDRLTVERNASYEFHSRTLMMSGSVTRNWNGGIMRLASMEGVVCGGAMTRVIAGPAGTMSAMMTGDVYGAIARVSAVRVYLAVLQYRAAKDAAWAIGVWLRRTTFTIVPAVPVPPAVTPKQKANEKMSRLSKAARKAMRTLRKPGKVARRGVSGARMVCPVVDILLGVASLPFAIIGLATLLSRLCTPTPKNVIPPAGPPRVLNSNSGVTLEVYMSKTFT